jgi:hypothetical protein
MSGAADVWCIRHIEKSLYFKNWVDLYEQTQHIPGGLLNKELTWYDDVEEGWRAKGYVRTGMRQSIENCIRSYRVDELSSIRRKGLANSPLGYVIDTILAELSKHPKRRYALFDIAIHIASRVDALFGLGEFSKFDTSSRRIPFDQDAYLFQSQMMWLNS